MAAKDESRALEISIQKPEENGVQGVRTSDSEVTTGTCDFVYPLCTCKLIIWAYQATLSNIQSFHMLY